MKLSNLLFTALIIFTVSSTFAQKNKDKHTITIGIPQVALLDLESSISTSISLTGIAPTEAGEAVTFNATNSDIWINYSSIVGSTTEPARTVSVQITDGEVPVGLELKVLAAKDAGKGDGKMGTAASAAQILSKLSANNLIEGVGSAYTGNGPSKGHQLTYTLSQSAAAGSYANLDFDKAQTLTITYTLSDN